ncbi:predicted protein [Chaetomium globosum CBS 148.51]|uniref:Uncharacterized protein n=1 Tax=Chaetomium globosum (strain ATCC 6205 / CBS 148.51 / DSM 1962 / NBRC 6347 / NRRL 1970) TaxID=306901 RepID=Q2GVG2_CHAGB|nr:uncharacterized protein CHGG_08042 [Chaetomium globosum CBS 148.51]EAQ86789.1 predicted protein [Chaetomium globosum CBS 148.51]
MATHTNADFLNDPRFNQTFEYIPPVLSTKDALAIKHKIRIISTDRPGMGGTDAVAPKDRLTVWRDAGGVPEGWRAGSVRLEVFYAETDTLTGDGGVASKPGKWFDGLWEGGVRDVVDYGSKTVKGADHDGIWWLRWGAVQQVFEAAGGAGERDEARDM